MIGYVVPALNPPRTLSEVVNVLKEDPDARIVVVDDGSSDKSGFVSLEELEGVTLLRHEANKGKGEALKTAFRYLLLDDAVSSIVTVDADGQHQAADIRRVADAARKSPDQLVLGVRSFEDDVPLRSRIGNWLTRHVLRILHGLNVTDSQTGLRSIPRRLVVQSLNSPSRRYGFELEMLLLADACETTILEVPIETIYLDGNSSSHFRPLLDSLGVYLVFLRFSAVSISSFFLDILLFALFHALSGQVYFSTYAARLLSGAFNFSMNRSVVFKAGANGPIELQVSGYVILALFVATASASLVDVLSKSTVVPATVVKVFVDPCLFMVSFLTQRLVIFRSRRRG